MLRNLFVDIIPENNIQILKMTQPHRLLPQSNQSRKLHNCKKRPNNQRLITLISSSDEVVVEHTRIPQTQAAEWEQALTFVLPPDKRSIFSTTSQIFIAFTQISQNNKGRETTDKKH
jgi:hypothetical protein